MILQSQNTLARLAAIIYSLGLCGLFGISALYHRPNWSQEKRLWMRRLDHAAIYILISSTATPICLLALPWKAGKTFLILTWIVATFGVLQSLFWVKAPKWISAIIYLLAGWMVMPYFSELKAALNQQQLLFIILGGVAYSLGALVYALKKPDPLPHIFGYHEIFHLLVVVAAFFHFLTNWQLLVQ